MWRLIRVFVRLGSPEGVDGAQKRRADLPTRQIITRFPPGSAISVGWKQDLFSRLREVAENCNHPGLRLQASAARYNIQQGQGPRWIRDYSSSICGSSREGFAS